MNLTTGSGPPRWIGLMLAGSLAVACTDQPVESTIDTTPRTAATEDRSARVDVEEALPVAALAALVEELPEELRVPGVVLGVSKDGARWVGAAGIDDTAAGTPMTADHQFRAASITKMFTAAVVMGLVDDGRLSLDDVVADWYPAFPNAEGITIRNLLSHTGGVTGDWWQQPDLAQLALDDMERVWTPEEVLDLMAERPPAGPAVSPTIYSNTGYILLGEIAAAVAGRPIDVLIEHRILRPLGMERTTYDHDAAPGLAHGYYDLDGATLDMGSLPMQALSSMAGAAGAIQTDADDLLTFTDALLGTDTLISHSAQATMRSDAEGRFRLGLMGFCPCGDALDGDGYAGWGHTGDIPGYFSATAHFADDDVSVVVFLNRDIVDGITFGHDHLDTVIESVVRLVSRTQDR